MMANLSEREDVEQDQNSRESTGKVGSQRSRRKICHRLFYRARSGKEETSASSAGDNTRPTFSATNLSIWIWRQALFREIQNTPGMVSGFYHSSEPNIEVGVVSQNMGKISMMAKNHSLPKPGKIWQFRLSFSLKVTLNTTRRKLLDETDQKQRQD